MENTYKLVWTDEAFYNLEGIISCLESRWTPREVKKFVQLLEKQLNLISTNPFLFAESEKLFGLRKSVLSKQIIIFYQVKDHKVYIVSLFDSRQNPNKLIIR